MQVAGTNIEPADQVCLVLPVGHPARGRAGGAALAQGKDTGTLRPRREEGIGVQADEQVGLHPACLGHPLLQGHKKITVAREVSLQWIALDAARIDALAQTQGQFQHHILFARAGRPDGAWVFAAVARVEGDHDQPVGARRHRCGTVAVLRFFGTFLASKPRIH